MPAAFWKDTISYISILGILKDEYLANRQYGVESAGHAFLNYYNADISLEITTCNFPVLKSYWKAIFIYLWKYFYPILSL